MPDAALDSAETRRLQELAGQGDEQAFEMLFARHKTYVRRVIMLRMEPELRRRLDPSDVIQETLIETHLRLRDYLASNGRAGGDR